MARYLRVYEVYLVVSDIKRWSDQTIVSMYLVYSQRRAAR